MNEKKLRYLVITFHVLRALLEFAQSFVNYGEGRMAIVIPKKDLGNKVREYILNNSNICSKVISTLESRNYNLMENKRIVIGTLKEINRFQGNLKLTVFLFPRATFKGNKYNIFRNYNELLAIETPINLTEEELKSIMSMLEIESAFVLDEEVPEFKEMREEIDRCSQKAVKLINSLIHKISTRDRTNNSILAHSYKNTLEVLNKALSLAYYENVNEAKEVITKYVSGNPLVPFSLYSSKEYEELKLLECPDRNLKEEVVEENVISYNKLPTPESLSLSVDLYDEVKVVNRKSFHFLEFTNININIKKVKISDITKELVNTENKVNEECWEIKYINGKQYKAIVKKVKVIKLNQEVIGVQIDDKIYYVEPWKINVNKNFVKKGKEFKAMVTYKEDEIYEINNIY